MAYNQPPDDYSHDVKLDQSVTLGEGASSLVWMNPTPMNNNFSTIFAGTFWDKTVRIFELGQGPMGASISQKAITNINSPATCCAWSSDNSSLYLGCGDGMIKKLDLNNMGMMDVGKHNAGVSTLNYINELNVLASTGYESKIHFWQGNPNPAFSLDVGNKVFCSDYKNGVMAGGILGEKIFLIDMANVSQQNMTLVDSVDLGKYSQLQSVVLDTKGETIGLATADGRANISGLIKGSNGSFKFNSIITFKSNKQ